MTAFIRTPTMATTLTSAAEKIRSLHRSTVANIVEIGRELIAVKGMLPHGEFVSWIDAEFGMVARTAQNYMSAVDLCEKNETVSHLDPTAIYALAAPSTPEPTRQEIIARVESGEKIAIGEVRAIIAEAKRERAIARIPADIREKKRKKEERLRRERDRARAERDREIEAHRSALRRAASLIRKFVPDLPELITALNDASNYELARELSTPVNSYAAAKDGDAA